MRARPATFYNVRMSEMEDWGDPKYVDVWADDVVTLSLQYSTQWDSLAHVGRRVRRRRRRGRRGRLLQRLSGRQSTWSGRGPTPGVTASRAPRFAHHLGLEHMAFHGVQGAGRPGRPGPPPRATSGAASTAPMLEEIMAADDVEVEPGDVLLLHTGFATRVLEWEREPDPVKIHTMCSYLDARDPSLLEWIADSQISALVADNYAVEGLLGKDRDPSRHSFLPLHHLCLFKLGVPLGEMWYLHELAGWLRRARSQPVPADRAAPADARASSARR